MTTRERIKPAADVPLVITLEDLNAPESHSQFTGLEYRYNVTRDGVACFVYLPAAAHQQIQRSLAQPGDQIELLKTARGNYSVQVLSDAAEPQVAQPVSHLRGHYPNGTATNGANGNRNVHAMPAPQPPAAAKKPERGSSHMAQCLCAAIDAAIEAQEYARTHNFSVTFLGSDVRAMANSLLIGDQQRGGVA